MWRLGSGFRAFAEVPNLGGKLGKLDYVVLEWGEGIHSMSPWRPGARMIRASVTLSKFARLSKTLKLHTLIPDP